MAISVIGTGVTELLSGQKCLCGEWMIKRKNSALARMTTRNSVTQNPADEHWSSLYIGIIAFLILYIFFEFFLNIES